MWKADLLILFIDMCVTLSYIPSDLGIGFIFINEFHK